MKANFASSTARFILALSVLEQRVIISSNGDERIMVLKPERLTFDELSERLRSYEQRYGYSTIEFYRRFQTGELGDDDDLMMWAGLYHLYLTSLPVRQFMQRADSLGS